VPPLPLVVHELPPPHATGDVSVTIDALRWSTTTIAALANGALAVEAFAEEDEARRRALEIGALLAGERGGHRIPGFDLGNSPLECTRERVAGRVICATTTNGTRALRVADGAAHSFVAAFVNLSVTADAIRALLAERRARGSDLGHVDIICAGTDGEPSPEDSACAAALVARIEGREHRVDLDALARTSPHAIRLAGLGYGRDVEFSLRVDAIPSVVMVTAGRCGTWHGPRGGEVAKG
jgi:2-phosphosulfolactate phosphatase